MGCKKTLQTHDSDFLWRDTEGKESEKQIKGKGTKKVMCYLFQEQRKGERQL